MTRTLITGAAGFTGRYLAQLLSARGHEVHGLVHGSTLPIADLAGSHEADLADFQSIDRVIAQISPDKVVHLAGIAFVAHDDVNDLYRSNIVGSRQLFESLSRLRKPPSCVVVASSANIYGNSRAGILDESLSPAPANDYGVSKLAVEYLSHLYSDRLPMIVVRPFNYTGRGQTSNFIIPKIIEHVHSYQRVIELGNLDVHRDFSDVRTVVDAYARLLDAPEAVGGTFNISSGEAVSLREIIEMVESISGFHFDVKVNPAFVRANEVHSLCGSARRLTTVIGPLNAIPLAETLRWMLEG